MYIVAILYSSKKKRLSERNFILTKYEGDAILWTGLDCEGLALMKRPRLNNCLGNIDMITN